MSSQWHRLRLPQKEIPPLLFQYTWTRKGYELYVTDLTSIWSERLPHQQVVRRAEENATTIDPSEGTEQLEIFLSKIGDALRGDGGNATLNKGSSADSLELTTSTKLPAPLEPLRWSLYLLKEPPSSLTGQLLLPLLKDEAKWETNRRFLLDQVKQKDWVLGKLFDKLEALGVDLGTVFPAATGLRLSRKGSSRSQAANFIKGIAPFDERSWLAESEKSSAGSSGLAANIVHETIGPDGVLDLANLHPPKDQWWNDLERHPGTSFVPEEETKAAAKDIHEVQKNQPAAPPELDLDRDGDDTTAESEGDEFQRQETPPRFKTRNKTPAISPPVSEVKKKSLSPQPPAEKTDQPTASEVKPQPEPEPAPHRKGSPSASPKPTPAAPQTQSQSQEPPKKPKGGLGVIGGKKKKEEKQPQRTPSPPSPKAPRPTRDNEPSHQPPSKTKRPTKLGMIRRKTKAKVPDQTETPPVQPEPATPSPKRARPASTLEADSEVPEPTPEESPVAERGRVPPVPEKAPETEKERADRRREELKRELEAKSNAPTKKKRRF